jgi:hypothetical protein
MLGLLLLLSAYVIETQYLKANQFSLQCANGFFFHSNLMECIQDTSRCSGNAILSRTIVGTAVTKSCTQCAANHIASNDQKFCLQCSGTDCSCPPSQIKLDHDQLGTSLSTMVCLSCPSYAYPNTFKSECIPCSDIQMTATLANSIYSCSCPSNFIEVL